MRKLWFVAVAGMIVAAALQAGPSAVPNREGVVGSDPPPVDMAKCNGINNFTKNCPKNDLGSSCGAGYRYYNSADSGGVNDWRFDKTGNRQCKAEPRCPPDIVDYNKGTKDCMKVPVP